MYITHVNIMCDWECSGVQGDTCGEELCGEESSGVDHGVEGGIHVAMLMLAITDDEEEAFKMTPTAAAATLLSPCTRFFVSFEEKGKKIKIKKEIASHHGSSRSSC